MPAEVRYRAARRAAADGISLNAMEDPRIRDSGRIVIQPGDRPDQFVARRDAEYWLIDSLSALILREHIRGESVEAIGDAIVKAHPGDPRLTDPVERAELIRVGLQNLVAHRILGDAVPPPSRGATPMLISQTIIPQPAVAKVAVCLAPLFQRSVAMTLCTLSGIVVALYALMFGFDALFPTAVSRWPQALTGESWLACIALFASCLVAHEFGHAAALASERQAPGAISVGLYWLLPVLHADVSAAWFLSRRGRVKVDCGGLYVQLLAVAVLCLLAMSAALSDEAARIIHYAVVLNVVSMVMSLNPFLRFDGYWVYSDVSGIPNLGDASMRFARTVGGYILKPGRRFIVNVRKAFAAQPTLAVYSSISIVVGALCIWYMSNVYARTLELMPVTLAQVVGSHGAGAIKAFAQLAFSAVVLVAPLIFIHRLVRPTPGTP